MGVLVEKKEVKELINEQEIADQVELELGRPTGQSLKVFVLINKLEVLGGLETHLYYLCRELKSRGHQVLLGCISVSPRLRKLFSFAEIFAGKTTRQLGDIINKYKVDIIHLHSDESAGTGLMLHQITNVPFVITWHGAYCFDSFPQIADKAEEIICVSEEVSDLLCIQHPEAQKKITVIQNGVDITEFKPVSAHKSLKEITFVSRVGEDRKVGLKTVIEGFLKSSFKKLNIVGLNKTDHKVYDSKINFVGEIENVSDFLTRADVFIGTGRGVREAMACGRPCIVMSNWGYDGIVMPASKKKLEYANFSGRGISKPLSPDSLLHDLRLLENRELRNKLGQYGRFLAENEYDNQKTTDKTEIIYNQVINNAGSRLKTLKNSVDRSSNDRYQKIIPVTSDCTVNSGFINNLDTDPVFIGGFNSTIYRYFAQADFSELVNNNIQILKAGFQFFCIRNDNLIPQKICIHIVQGPWEEKTINWLNKPEISKVSAADTETGSTYCWIYFDITELVRRWINHKQTNYGICLKLHDEYTGTVLSGFNRHYLNTVARPRLFIEYTKGI